MSERSDEERERVQQQQLHSTACVIAADNLMHHPLAKGRPTLVDRLETENREISEEEKQEKDLRNELQS